MSDSEKELEISVIPAAKKKRRGGGGARPGAGRPKGSTNKVTPQDLLKSFNAVSGMSFNDFVAAQMINAHQDGDKELLSKYVLGLAKYLIQDTTHIDVTSDGKSIAPVFNFTAAELSDWDKNKPTNED
jgi:hypothetical protein